MVRQNLGTYRRVSEHAILGFDETAIKCVPFINFSHEPQLVIHLDFDSLPSKKTASLSSKCDVAIEGNSLTCKFDSPVSVGECIIVSTGRDVNEFAKFKSARWGDSTA